MDSNPFFENFYRIAIFLWWGAPGTHPKAPGTTRIDFTSIEKIDFIVFATLSPDYYFPGPGVQIQEALEIDTVGALDVRNQCSGFIYGLSVADQFIKTGMYKNILVIGSELQSRGIDISTRGRSISVIFGDGAGAAILSRENDTTKGILSSHLHSEGAHAGGPSGPLYAALDAREGRGACDWGQEP